MAISRNARWIALIGTLLFALRASSRAQDDLELGQRDDRHPPDDRKLLITHLRPSDGILDDEAVTVWRRNLEDWLNREEDIRFVLVRIDARGTSGGDLEPVKDVIAAIRNIKRLAPGARTIAHVDVGDQASNAVAAIALACDDLVMGQDSRVGFLDDAETLISDAKEHDAKTARGLLGEQAALDDSVPTALAEAFVSKYHQAVYWVAYAKPGDVEPIRRLRSADGLAAEKEDPVKKAKIDDRAQVTVVDEGKTLTLDASRAMKYGISKTVLANSIDAEGLDEFLLDLGLENIQDHNIIDEQRGAIEASSPHGQAFVNFLNHPVTRFVLLLVAFLGLVLEFKMPGTFVPIACASVAFLVFFIGGLFPAFEVTGVNVPTTNAFEIVLFLVGMGLVITELFLMPGVAYFAILGVVFIFVSLVMAMTPPAGLTSESAMTFRDSLMVLVFALATGFGLFFALLRFLPQTSFFGRSGLITNASVTGVATGDDIVAVQERNLALVGRRGKAATPLRPAGKIQLDGRELDVVAEGGEFIDKNEEVEIIEASVVRTIVRRATGGGSESSQGG